MVMTSFTYISTGDFPDSFTGKAAVGAVGCKITSYRKKGEKSLNGYLMERRGVYI